MLFSFKKKKNPNPDSAQHCFTSIIPRVRVKTKLQRGRERWAPLLLEVSPGSAQKWRVRGIIKFRLRRVYKVSKCICPYKKRKNKKSSPSNGPHTSGQTSGGACEGFVQQANPARLFKQMWTTACPQRCLQVIGLFLGGRYGNDAGANNTGHRTINYLSLSLRSITGEGAEQIVYFLDSVRPHERASVSPDWTSIVLCVDHMWHERHSVQSGSVILNIYHLF